MTGVIIKTGLGSRELEDIRRLDEACAKHDGTNMKLNWDMLESRPSDEANDILYYEDDELIGFLGMYSMFKGAADIEITGMVHPCHRRKGIFGRLFAAAREESIKRGAARLLMITERVTPAGEAFIKNVGASYAFSEYRMVFNEKIVPDFPGTSIKMRKAEYEDYPVLAGMDADAFDQPSSEEQDHSTFDYSTTYIAELDGRLTGKIGTLMDGGSGYIFGFSVKPEYRGRGYGRQILSLILQRLVGKGISPVILEVAVKNERALSLYESCGFRRLTVYDYYEDWLSSNKGEKLENGN
jgi:ribosomal protein S18 acetylase RimI-like enzyme